MNNVYLTHGLPTPWDDGVTWHIEQTAAEGPDLALDPLTLEFIRDQHLRSAAGGTEDQYIEFLRKASYRRAEKMTRLALIPQTKRLILDRFPSSEIVFDFPPLLAIDSVAYVGQDGTEGEVAGSPAEYEIELGDASTRGRITPLTGASWPSTRYQPDAVVVTFTAGFELVNGLASIPEDINEGRLLMIGEMYKQRSESVHAFNQNPALVRARDLWMAYRKY